MLETLLWEESYYKRDTSWPMKVVSSTMQTEGKQLKKKKLLGIVHLGCTDTGTCTTYIYIYIYMTNEMKACGERRP